MPNRNSIHHQEGPLSGNAAEDSEPWLDDCRDSVSNSNVYGAPFEFTNEASSITRESVRIMFRQFRKFPRIHGKIVPGRRFTANTVLYFGAFVALPLLAITSILDFVGWLITVKLFGASCYGVMCLF
jgi:hypothetical protein